MSASAFALAPLAMATSLLTAPVYGAVRMPRNSEFGASMVTTTVCASGASMLFTPSIMKDGPPLMFCSRSQDHLTSFASTGEPSENTASGSRWKVNCVWSAFDSHFVARRGITLFSGRDRSGSHRRSILDLAGVAPGPCRVERVDVHRPRDHERRWPGIAVAARPTNIVPPAARLFQRIFEIWFIVPHSHFSPLLFSFLILVVQALRVINSIALTKLLERGRPCSTRPTRTGADRLPVTWSISWSRSSNARFWISPNPRQCLPSALKPA